MAQGGKQTSEGEGEKKATVRPGDRIGARG